MEKRIRSDDSDESDHRSDKRCNTRREEKDGVSLESPSSEGRRRGRGRGRGRGRRGRGRGRGRKSDGGDDYKRIRSDDSDDPDRRSVKRCNTMKKDKDVVSIGSPSSEARRRRRGRNSDDREETKQDKDDNSDGTKKNVGLTCHQCKIFKGKSDVVFCSKCAKTKKRFCYDCIERWYPERTPEEVQAACPVCMGNCNCRDCLRKPLLVKKPREKDASVKIKQLRYLLVKALPVLRDIYAEQNRELEVETAVRGFPVTEADITMSKLDPRERVYWQ